MINAVLVFNNSGQPRLTKFYTQLETSVQQRLISEIFTLVSHRTPGSCNFLPLPPLLSSQSTPTHSANTSSSSASVPAPSNDVPSLITYRNYATLYFIIISTSTESPLALIDLIHVYVEALDRLFEEVRELDLIFNFEILHATLSEMIVGGVVVETSLDRVVEGVRAQGKIPKRPLNEQSGMGGISMGMGGNFAWTGRSAEETSSVDWKDHAAYVSSWLRYWLEASRKEAGTAFAGKARSGRRENSLIPSKSTEFDLEKLLAWLEL